MSEKFTPCTSLAEERYIDAAQPVNPNRGRKKCEVWHDKAVALQALNAELVAALKYARRMLRAGKVDYDDFFVSDLIEKAQSQ